MVCGTGHRTIPSRNWDWVIHLFKKHLWNEWLLGGCEYIYNIHICKNWFQVLSFASITFSPTVEHTLFFYNKEGVVVIPFLLTSPVGPCKLQGFAKWLAGLGVNPHLNPVLFDQQLLSLYWLRAKCWAYRNKCDMPVCAPDSMGNTDVEQVKGLVRGVAELCGSTQPRSSLPSMCSTHHPLFLAPAAPMWGVFFHIFSIWISLHLTIQIQFKGHFLRKAFPVLCPPPNLFPQSSHWIVAVLVRYSVADCVPHGKS